MSAVLKGEAVSSTRKAGGAPPLAENTVLAARDVSVRLGGNPILKSVSFEARAGEVAGLIGPNGAGKSTLLRVLAGLLRPESGEVWIKAPPPGPGTGGAVEGEPLKGLNSAQRARRIAFMPQHDATHPFTAIETVLMGRYAHLGRFELEGRQDREIALSAMARTDTAQFEDRQLDRLSGGERQRVILARALAQQAGVILLDEPSASLDLRHRLSIMETLREEVASGKAPPPGSGTGGARRVAVVVALHDVSLASRYCDRLTLLYDGRITAEGPPVDVLTPQNLRNAFGVETAVQIDPATGSPQVWLIGPSV